MIEVVSAIIIRDRRILLTQRRPDKDFPFTWESPGGKVEGNESHHQALRREITEEIGIELSSIPMHPAWCGRLPRGDGTEAFVSLYRAEFTAGTPTSREGQGVGWFSSSEMARLSLAPANSVAAHILIKLIER